MIHFNIIHNKKNNRLTQVGALELQLKQNNLTKIHPNVDLSVKRKYEQTNCFYCTKGKINITELSVTIKPFLYSGNIVNFLFSKYIYK